MRRVVLVGLLGLLAGCNQIFGLTQAHEGKTDGQHDAAIDASCPPGGGCACDDDSFCQSKVCAISVNPNGSNGSGVCADESQVAYVAATGTATAPCTLSEPCSTITRALTTTTAAAISVSGHIVDNVAIAQPQTLSIYGAGSDTELISALAGVDVFSVDAAGADVTVLDLTITGGGVGGGSNVANGVSIGAQGGDLTMFRCTVTNNAGLGVLAAGPSGNLLVTQSTVSHNGSGGLDLEGGVAVVTNDFIVVNGNTNGTVGGILVASALNVNSVFEYDTVADNTISMIDDTVATGVMCHNDEIQVINSIVADNVFGEQASAGSDMLGCINGGSNQGSSFVGDDPGNAMLMFVMPPDDFHLQLGSHAIGAGKMDAIMVDVEGNGRPQQANSSDLGAHEYFKDYQGVAR